MVCRGASHTHCTARMWKWRCVDAGSHYVPRWSQWPLTLAVLYTISFVSWFDDLVRTPQALSFSLALPLLRKWSRSKTKEMIRARWRGWSVLQTRCNLRSLNADVIICNCQKRGETVEGSTIYDQIMQTSLRLRSLKLIINNIHRLYLKIPIVFLIWRFSTGCDNDSIMPKNYMQ